MTIRTKPNRGYPSWPRDLRTANPSHVRPTMPSSITTKRSLNVHLSTSQFCVSVLEFDNTVIHNVQNTSYQGNGFFFIWPTYVCTFSWLNRLKVKMNIDIVHTYLSKVHTHIHRSAVVFTISFFVQGYAMRESLRLIKGRTCT